MKKAKVPCGVLKTAAVILEDSARPDGPAWGFELKKLPLMSDDAILTDRLRVLRKIAWRKNGKAA